MQILVSVFASAAHSHGSFIFYLRVPALPVASAQKRLQIIVMEFKEKRLRTNLLDVCHWNLVKTGFSVKKGELNKTWRAIKPIGGASTSWAEHPSSLITAAGLRRRKTLAAQRAALPLIPLRLPPVFQPRPLVPGLNCEPKYIPI